MSAQTRGKNKLKQPVREIESPGMFSYLMPYLLIPALLAAGYVLHKQLGNSVPEAPLAALFVAAGGAVLTFITWLYAQGRKDLVRWHASVTVIIDSVMLDMLLIFGVNKLLFWLTIGMGIVAAISWNIPRTQAIRGDGSDTHQIGLLEQLGLNVRRSKVVTDTDKRFDIDLKLAEGQTIADVHKVTPAIGSQLETLTGGVHAVALKREGEVRLSGEMHDVLLDNIPWKGPHSPGGSIADGLTGSTYRDSQPFIFFPVGNYKLNIAPGNTATGGAPRSGKGVLSRTWVTEASTRIDAWIMLADIRKADQFVGPIKDAIDWYADTPAKVKAQLHAVERAMQPRAKILGQYGYTDGWTKEAYLDPRLKMSAVMYFIEEGAAVLGNNIEVIIDMGEACLSSGIFLFVSMQRWAADRVPTSFRSSFSNKFCFGTEDDHSAGFLLRSSTLKSAPDPQDWGSTYPGRHLAEVNGIEQYRYSVPLKGNLPTNQQLTDVISKYKHLRPELDSVTREAFGRAYDPDTAKPSTELSIVKSTLFVPEQTAQPEEIEDEEIEEEDELVIPPSPDPEITDKVNYREPIPEWIGDEVDMRPEPQPGDRELSQPERMQIFMRMINDFFESGKHELKMSEIRDEWKSRVGELAASKKTFVSRIITKQCQLGYMERIEGQSGTYRILSVGSINQEVLEDMDYDE